MYINIHSHHAPEPNVFTLQNLDREGDYSPENGFFSFGLHPWFIPTQDWMAAFERIKTISLHRNVLAIGECGLDPFSETPMITQEEVFVAQLRWASEIKKPLIIHCVRMYGQLLQLLKKHHVPVPVIFHGFNRNSRLAHQIIDAGHWLSFGKALTQPAMRDLFNNMPQDRIFLETDDAAMPIARLYKEAAQIKNISQEELSLQLKKNLHTVFNVIV